MFYRKIFFPTTTSRRLPSMNCLALQMVFVIGTVSTALAAPTLIPPSEAFPGHDNPSDEPLHQLQPATGFLTVRLDVREPQETAIFLDVGVIGSGDIFNKTRALSAGEESSDAPLPHPFHADKFSAIETDVHEPQTTTIALVESVTGSDGFFDETWISRDGADVYDHDHNTIIDTPYVHVNSKSLRRRADDEFSAQSESVPGSPQTPDELTQDDVDANYKYYLEYIKQANKYHHELAELPPAVWGRRENRYKIYKALENDRIALRHLQNAHKCRESLSVGVEDGRNHWLDLLPNYAEEEKRMKGQEAKYAAAVADHVPGTKIKHVQEDAVPDGQPKDGKRRQTASRTKNAGSSAAAGGIPTDESGLSRS